MVTRPNRAGAFRYLVVALLLVSAACESAPTVIPATSVATPKASVSRSAPAVRVWLDDPAYFVQLEREMVVDGDRTLLLGLDFNMAMQQADVEGRLSVTLPAGTIYEWTSQAAMRARVPAGDSFDIALVGARSQGGGALGGATWHIARPASGIALYRLEGSDAWPQPLRSFEVQLVVQNGLLIFAPDGQSALLYHGLTPRHSEFSLVDLTTGRHLAQPFSRIASSGWSVMDWTVDRRLVAVGPSETLLGDERGTDPVNLRGYEGQGGLLSPSRRFLYLWSCTAHEAWMLDLAANREWRLSAELPCASGSSVAWTPADELAVGDATGSSPTFRVRVFDPAGGLRRTLAGFRPMVALAGDAFVVGHRVTQAYRDDGGPFYLLDIQGVEHLLPDGVLFRPSPDGRFLAYTSFDGDTPTANVWNASGGQPLMMRDARVGGWTKDGTLAIVTIIRP